MAETLTTTLRLELEKTHQQFTRWSGAAQDWVVGHQNEMSRVFEECDSTIQALQATDQQLEAARDAHRAVKQQQLQEIQQVIAENESYRQQLNALDTQLRHYEAEEETAQSRLETIRTEHDQQRVKMEQTLQDLTHGLRFYTKLGLEFQKADGEAMRFIFTQIDPANPTRQFFFTMFVDDKNTYQLVETSPTLPANTCAQYIQNLNEHNDISVFVFQMRKLFCGVCK